MLMLFTDLLEKVNFEFHHIIFIKISSREFTFRLLVNETIMYSINYSLVLQKKREVAVCNDNCPNNLQNRCFLKEDQNHFIS